MRAIIGAVLLMTAGAGMTFACGGTYIVKPGDSLSKIANIQYDNARLWTEIYRANAATVGPEPDLLFIGTHLALSCINGLPAGLPGGATATTDSAMELPDDAVAQANLRPLAPVNPIAPLPRTRPVALLSSDGYRPFADRNAPDGGLITALLTEAMRSVAPEQGFEVHWVNDRAAHLDPLLENALLDIGFPWIKPDCGGVDGAQGCSAFLYSDPVFETLTVMFSRRSDPVAYRDAAQLNTLRVCQPKVETIQTTPTADGRGARVTHPDAASDCFVSLMNQEVDAVIVNEFSGRVALTELGLTERVGVAGNRPVSLDSLHAVVHRDHPDAAALLNLVNAGLRQIRGNDRYQKVLEQHLGPLWTAY